MSHSKFTPGPWQVNVWTTGRRTVEGVNAPTIAEIHDTHEDVEKAANARLIAAAPDLYEALRELTALMEDVRTGQYTPDSFTTQPARITLAKAEGRKP